MSNTAPRSDARSVRLLVPLTLATIASQSSMASVAPLFVDIGHSFGISVGAAGQVRSVAAGFAVATALLVGGWIHRNGPRPVLVAGGVLAALGAAGSALAPNFAALIVAQAVVGVGICCLLSSGFAGAGHFFGPHARDWAVGWITALQAVAWIVGVPLVGVLATAFGWRAGFIVPAVFCATAALVALALAPREGGDVDETDERTGLLAALGDRDARRWTLGELIAFAVWTGEITYIASFYIVTYGLSVELVGVLIPTGSAAFIIGSAGSQRLGRYVPRRVSLAASAVAMGAVALLLFNFHPNVVFTLGVGFLMGIVAGIRSASSSMLALDQLPDRPGAMMAARTAAVQIGYLIGAAVGGIAVDTAGFGSLGVLMIVGMSFSALVMSTVSGRDETGTQHEAATATAQ